MSRVAYAGDGPATGVTQLAQGLRSYVQGTLGASGAPVVPASFSLPGGTYTFYVSGQGGPGNPNAVINGGPGGLVVKTALIQITDSIATSVAADGSLTVNLPGGVVLAAGAGKQGSISSGSGQKGMAGTASGGDANLVGSDGGAPPTYNGITATGFGTSSASGPSGPGPASLLIVRVS